MRTIPGPVVCAVMALSAISMSGAPRAQTAVKKPNLLWIISDDLNMDLGCYGDSSAITPHIDALAASGLRFDRAYAQYTLCSPSRTSFLSGKRPDTTRIWDNHTDPRKFLGRDYVLLPEYFHNHGYFTGGAGKISHFANSLAWDSYLNTKEEPDSLTHLADMIHAMSWQATGLPDSEMQDGITARRIGDLMKVKRAKPFFLAAGFHKPHTPCVAPRRYFDMHPRSGIRLRPQIADDLLDIPKSAFFLRESLLTDTEWKMFLQARAASVSFMDAQVGYLMRLLDSLDLRKNTIVVFQSDHGFLLGEHQGGCYKTTLFDPTSRVPLIVAAPGSAKGGHTDAFVELVDLYPTLADLCGLPQPPGMEGTSFAPLLAAPALPWKAAAFTQVYKVPQEDPFTASEIKVPFMAYSMRTDRYRFTDWKDFGREAYDEAADPDEFTNLVFNGAQRRLGDSLSALLTAGWKAALPGKPTAVVGRSADAENPAAHGKTKSGPDGQGPGGGGRLVARSYFERGGWWFRSDAYRTVDPAGKVRGSAAAGNSASAGNR